MCVVVKRFEQKKMEPGVPDFLFIGLLAQPVVKTIVNPASSVFVKTINKLRTNGSDKKQRRI